MISNEKIYRIAKGLNELWGNPPFDSPTAVMSYFRDRKDQAAEYVKAFGPDNFLKITIAMWGISVGLPPTEVEKMYENLFFATIFYTYGDYSEDECSDCNGNGSIDCDYCDGNGRTTCDECEGEGTIECSTCEGEGEVQDESGAMVPCTACDGEGTVDCDNCDGDSDVRCEECHGSGNEECEYCNGSGTVTSDTDKDYTVEFIASWNPFLKNKCELEEGSLKPITSTTKFESLNSVISLAIEDSKGELNDEVQDNKVYCLEYAGDSVKLHFRVYGVSLSMPNWDADYLLA